MILYYVRHGDPIYDPNSLTPLGQRQAEALAKRFGVHGLDRIYSSPSNRALQTAQPTCEILKKKPILVDFADETHAWREITVKRDDGKPTWVFQSKRHILLCNTREIRDLGERWFDHPEFAQYDMEKGFDRIADHTDAFLAELGYVHMRHTGRYRIRQHNQERVALFAHQGFGLAFLSCVLDIPYPMLCTHFDMGHTGVTVIEFRDVDGYCVPRVLTLSSDAHLYREGLPTKYQNEIYI